MTRSLWIHEAPTSANEYKPVKCRVCGKRFRRVNPNHGFMHERRAEARVDSTGYYFATRTTRYQFVVDE